MYKTKMIDTTILSGTNSEMLFTSLQKEDKCENCALFENLNAQTLLPLN